MIAATVISAGTSSRMGYPKALLEFHGCTFLETILEAMLAVGVQRRIVVLGPDADKILKHIDLRDVTVLSTERLEAGPIGSIRAAIREVQAHPVDGLLVWPVDMPQVTIATVETLLEQFRRSDRPMVVPEFEGTRGHPIIFGRAVFDELLAAPDAEGARAVVRADTGRVLRVPVDDPAVAKDLNTPEEYQEFMKRQDEAVDGSG